ncbi:hypothetical protein R1flu_001584 [Riccia fluitans]|uniref:AB hydrolase-1 domain-containing protein n=1 Tax=Riccia fluitans TaxID=41844 RepID=A0ABD1Y7N2_9MARC
MKGQGKAFPGVMDDSPRIRLISVFVALLVCSITASVQGRQAEEPRHYLGLKSDSGQKSVTFVLVHGSMHGAWCWYKVVTLLQERGYNVAALDLKSLGRDKTSADSVVTMAQLTEPAIQLITNITGKVIIVGHSSGGFAISYVMEQFAEKIEKAVFLAAMMPLNGVKYEFFRPSAEIGDRLFYYYGNGPNSLPTSFLINPIYAPGAFYPKSPKEDVTLALSLLAPHPMQPYEDALTLSPERYGRVRRYYIKTIGETPTSQATQDNAIESNPPERVFEIDSDHSAFFTKPVDLTSILEKIYYL